MSRSECREVGRTSWSGNGDCLLTGAQELVRVCIRSVSWSGNGDCLLTGAQEWVMGLSHVPKSGA